MSLLQEYQLLPFHHEPLPHARGPWLVFAPHPDDESFGMGGSIVNAVNAGIAVDVVVLTDGAQGGSGSDLVERRQQEVRAAAQVLGLHSVQFLAEPDRGLRATEPLALQLATLITNRKPAAVFFPGVLELHPDHRSAALLVWRSLQLLGAQAPQAIAYEITGQSPANCLVDISAAMLAKQQAIACYASQLGENNYLDLVHALNRLRTLTLRSEVQWAEAFYRYSSEELALPLPIWAAQRISTMLNEQPVARPESC